MLNTELLGFTLEKAERAVLSEKEGRWTLAELAADVGEAHTLPPAKLPQDAHPCWGALNSNLMGLGSDGMSDKSYAVHAYGWIAKRDLTLPESSALVMPHDYCRAGTYFHESRDTFSYALAVAEMAGVKLNSLYTRGGSDMPNLSAREARGHAKDLVEVHGSLPEPQVCHEYYLAWGAGRPSPAVESRRERERSIEKSAAHLTGDSARVLENWADMEDLTHEALRQARHAQGNIEMIVSKIEAELS